MTAPQVRFAPVGDACLVVEFGRTLSLPVNAAVVAFAQHLRALRLPFVTDISPALAAVGVHYWPHSVPLQLGETPYAAMQRIVDAELAGFTAPERVSTDVQRIPVCYGAEFGPDLQDVASRCGLSPDEVIRIHSGYDAVVMMVCFAPGLPQMGLWDEGISVPRRNTPRLEVAAGSVAIANRQTVIYPFAVPGGWNVIGRTPVTLFDVGRARPCLLEPGVKVRFEPISAQQFDERMAQERQ